MSMRRADWIGTDILRLSDAGCPFALGVVVEAQGSSAGRAGARALFDVEGEVIAGWVGGGCAESMVAHAAVEACASGTPQLVEVDLDSEVLGAGMPCGGRMRIYVEPVLPRPALWVLGPGRVAESLCHLGALLGFAVVVDDVMAGAGWLPEASRVIADDPHNATVTRAVGDFAVVAAQHRGDHGALRRLLSSALGHIALIASCKRAGLVRPVRARPASIARRSLGSRRRPVSLSTRARPRNSRYRSSRRSCWSAAAAPTGKRRCSRKVWPRYVPSHCAS